MYEITALSLSDSQLSLPFGSTVIYITIPLVSSFALRAVSFVGISSSIKSIKKSYPMTSLLSSTNFLTFPNVDRVKEDLSDLKLRHPE